VPTPDETSAPLSTHLALALTRYVRQRRKDGFPVSLVLDELAAGERARACLAARRSDPRRPSGRPDRALSRRERQR